MQVPGLGEMTKDDLGLYSSEPLTIPRFGGEECRIVLEGYDDDADQEQFHKAIAN